MPNQPTPSAIPASKWHAEIAFELRNPALPADAPQKLVDEITNQRERHETFAKVLRRISTAKPVGK